MRRSLAVCLVLCGYACSTVQPDLNKPHHATDGFVNMPPTERAGFSDFLKWQWQRWTNPEVAVLRNPLPVMQPDLEFLRANRREFTVTWIGHATLLVQLGGLNILTDPQFSERASPLTWLGPKRLVPPTIALNDLPPIDVVLISHDHYDSLDEASVQALRARPGGEQTTFYVPLRIKEWLVDRGITRVVELDWWQSVAHEHAEVIAVPAQHWSQRWLFAPNRTLWAGFIVRTAQGRFYFAGDSGYAPLFKTIGKKYGPIDLAALPIGAYEPRWFMQGAHMNPEDAVQVHQDVRAVRSVGMHWGTFRLTDEPVDEPPQRLAQARAAAGLPEHAFVALQHGETLRLGEVNR